MKNVKFICILILSLILVACNNNHDTNTESKADSLPDIPKKVFSNDKNGKDISKKEIKNSLKKYLDTFDSLEKNAAHIRNKENLNEQEKKELEDILKLMNSNNKNFEKYITNNNLPENFEDESFKIYNYLKSAENLISKLYAETEIAMEDKSSNNEKLKAAENIKSINSDYKERINGKKEKEIKDFLNKNNINTKAFD